MTAYDVACAKRCEGCARGLRRWRGESRSKGVWYEHRAFGSSEVLICTAPTKDQYVEELAAQLAEARKDSERLDWLSRESEIERNRPDYRSLFRMNRQIDRAAIDASRKEAADAAQDHD